MGGQDDGGALSAVEFFDEIAHRQFGNRVEANGRLVQKEQAGAVEQSRHQITAHALAQAELAHGHVEEGRKFQHGDERVAAAAVGVGGHFVDVAQQIEGFNGWQVPPQLGALAEDHANAADVGNAVLPRDAALDLAAARIGDDDAGEDFDCGGFAGTVGADITD